MRDEDIRRILIMRKREAAKEARRQEILEVIEGVFCWSSLFFIGFMLSVIG